MTKFIINGKSVTQAQWNNFTSAIAGGKDISSYTQDNQIDAYEIDKILDINGDGKITHTDFSKFDVTRFKNLKEILYKNRYYFDYKLPRISTD